MHVLCVAILLAAQSPDAPAAPTAMTADEAGEAGEAGEAVEAVEFVDAPDVIGVLDAAPKPPAAAPTDAAWRQMHGVLSGYASQGRTARVATAVGAGAVSAAMIGVAITYVAVGNVDVQLSKLDAEDTQLAGYIAGAGAILPAAIMVGALVTSSDEEDRLAAFEAPAATPADRQARVDAARASLSASADDTAWLRVAGGGVLIAGGLVSAGVGGRFIQLPHLAEPRGIVSHSIGAELIGAGLIAAVVGGTLIATSGSNAGAQLAILGE